MNSISPIDYCRCKGPFELRFAALMLDSVIALPGYMAYIVPGLIIFGFRDSFSDK